MIIFEHIKDLRDHLANVRPLQESIGFVPTMGALHDGHLALVRRSKSCTGYTVCSIFVNPVQFNNPEDLSKYPRTFEKDVELLNQVNCDVLFYPSVREMYPEEITEKYAFGELEQVMEGAHRPGHFNGVAVVVKRLLDIVDADRAYFGEKDFQQLLIVKALVKQCNIRTEIIPCPTVREPDGLAMSSRNTRLSPPERQAAPAIYKALKQIPGLLKTNSLPEIKEMLIREIQENGILKVEYLDFADAATLKIVQEAVPSGQKLIACIAVHAGPVRLIDNFQFNS